MATIRERWSGRWTLVIAGLAVAGGLAPLWLLPRLLEAHGGAAFLVAWFALVLVLSLPVMWYEMALGVVLQGAMPDALRRSHRRWEWFGWWAGAVALVVGVLLLASAATLGVHGLRAAVVVVGGELGIATAATTPTLASPGIGGAALLACLACAWLVGWLGGGGTARLGPILNRCLAPALGLIAVAFVLGLAQSAGTAGFARGFRPEWGELLETRTWLAAAGMACSSTLAGCGILTACGSQRPRTSDVGGSVLLILLLLLAVQVLIGCAALTLIGRASMLAGEVVPALGRHIPLLLGEPLAAIDPDQPRLGGVAVLAVTLGLAGFLILGAGVVVHTVVTAWCDRTGDERALVARRLGWGLGAAALLLVSPQGWWWQAALVDGLILWALLPLVAVIAWAAVWHIGIEGLLDHTSAYSTLRPTGWWTTWLGVLIPVLLTAMWWGRVLDRWATGVEALPWWLTLPVAIALLGLPLLALVWGRIGRGEGEVPPRRIAVASITALALAALAALLVAAGTASDRRSGEDLRRLAERWVADDAWQHGGRELHPLTVARRAWAAGRIEIAEGAIELWAGQDEPDRAQASILAEDIAAHAMSRLAQEPPHATTVVLADLRLLRALDHAPALERVEAAWRVAAWVEPESPGLLRAAADALRAGDDGSDGLRRVAQRWRGLASEAEPASLLTWTAAPDPAGAAAREAVAALREHAAALPGRSDAGPRDRAVAIAVLQEAGLWSQVPIERRRWLAAAQLRAIQPGPALGTALGIGLVLLAAIALLLRRMAVGPGPIDPSADTLEHVDPVDVDSQAVTLEGEYTTDDATTTSGSRPLPSA